MISLIVSGVYYPDLVLDTCARDNWQSVRPSIFGNIFESAIETEQRHAHGIHFTSELDIRQIVRPTITDYWEAKVEAATTIAELTQLQLELQSYRVLDPACGSGNFLYVAYQELKRIEQVLIAKLSARRKADKEQGQISFVSPTQFLGMDTNPFAVELARVTLMIGRKIAIDKYELTEAALPLDTLDRNILCTDALFTPWPKADAVIGNPPFLGGKYMRLMLGDEYIDRIFEQYAEVRDSVDFCTYWFRLAHDCIAEGGRAGLVGTNSIAQGKSRAAALDYIMQKGGHIHEAISTQAWSGEAAVHVSIVNWCMQKPEIYRLDHKEVFYINSSLASTIDVTQANRLRANQNYCFQGVIPVGKGFLITSEQARQWIQADQKNFSVLKQFSMGSNLAKNPHGKPIRWIIDFNDMSFEEASDFSLPFAHVKKVVKPERDKNRDSVAREVWWQFLRPRPAMRTATAHLEQYFCVPETSKWSIFLPCPSQWLTGNGAHPVASEDFYILGVLTSWVHRSWAKAQCSTLKGDTRYTHTSSFETFPFPQIPSAAAVEAVRQTMQALHDYRSEQMERKQWGITKLYNAYFDEPASRLYKLHAELDALVLDAYGFDSEDDVLEQLFALNQTLATKEASGESVVGPWAP